MNGQRMSLLSLCGRRRGERGVGQGSDLEQEVRFQKTRMELNDCGSC